MYTALSTDMRDKVNDIRDRYDENSPDRLFLKKTLCIWDRRMPRSNPSSYRPLHLSSSLGRPAPPKSCVGLGGLAFVCVKSDIRSRCGPRSELGGHMGMRRCLLSKNALICLPRDVSCNFFSNYILITHM